MFLNDSNYFCFDVSSNIKYTIRSRTNSNSNAVLLASNVCVKCNYISFYICIFQKHQQKKPHFSLRKNGVKGSSCAWIQKGEPKITGKHKSLMTRPLSIADSSRTTFCCNAHTRGFYDKKNLVFKLNSLLFNTRGLFYLGSHMWLQMHNTVIPDKNWLYLQAKGKWC